MNTQIIKHSVLVCPEYRKDIKALKKKFKRPELSPPIIENHNGYSDSQYFLIIPLNIAIYNFISELCNSNNYDMFDLWDKQPYLDKGWRIYKLRYGFAGKGKSNGLRIMFLEHKEKKELLFVFVNIKSQIDIEYKFRKQILIRLGDYFTS